MEIFIRVDEDGFGEHGWLHHDEDQSYLETNLWNEFDECNATAAKSVKEAKHWMKEAAQLMEFDGAIGKVKASAWRFVRGILTETKFTKDNKIKQ